MINNNLIRKMKLGFVPYVKKKSAGKCLARIKEIMPILKM